MKFVKASGWKMSVPSAKRQKRTRTRRRSKSCPLNTAALQRIVQFAHAHVGLFIGRVFGIEAHSTLPQHEGEGADVVREILKAVK